ncbi:hypothetical protein ABB37_02259 [Leptomonas pyrrhocoris]|uniref:Uncharacterized protein n=1 Tax=Leptomonas pyrrhocoris TaxID=157538 RepID=A0A0N0VGR8_LEPPY|nr:hypothetical protein ABB37_02259 [Leptomonas pyrrhocoris]KPA84201.1 hypothetical protein ABB37_02259 [Leptomonas pyrrhocoris]|eukprot:XP_015662640.1 hypothetical protein ABB37_02259 [Leptomonas pyrrhocoris]
MSAAGTLSIDSRKWVETIEASGVECLCSPVSAKNVTHVLSTATVRGPQKQLCAAVSNFVPGMLENAHGISILTALVCYGTPATVELISGKLIAVDEGVWSFTAAPSKELTKPLSHLLERLVYREDCTGKSRKALLDKLQSAENQALFSSLFTLPAAARLMVVDPSVAQSFAASANSQKTFAESCQDPVHVAGAEEFCRILLETPTDVAVEFLWKSLAGSLKPTSKTHPRESVLAVLAARAPVLLVNKLAGAVAQWSNLHALCERDAYMEIVAQLLERMDDEKTGNKLVAAVVTQKTDITDRVQSRKAAPHHLLAALTAKPYYAKALEKQLGESQTKLLTAAKVRFVNATQPKAVSTQRSILEKLTKLNASGAGAKRARE